MPYIVLEALAAGLPMVATAVGGIPEIFGRNSPALVHPDTGELAEKMAEALADPPSYRMLMPAPAELQARFGANVMAAAIERAYFAALGGT
jgi:glycosyltransferase involved in cell wall biosynthesis